MEVEPGLYRVQSKNGTCTEWRDSETHKIVATENNEGWSIHSKWLGCPDKKHMHTLSRQEFAQWRVLGGGIRGAVWYLALFRSCKIAGVVRAKPWEPTD